jgi:hypothetical protein
MFGGLLDAGVRIGGAFGGCPDDDRSWFWYELDRWPDADVTNGPRADTPSGRAAYQSLLALRRGQGARLRCVVEVWVRNRTVLGATLFEPSGDPSIDRLAVELYPPLPALGPTDASRFRVTVYGRAALPRGATP